MPEPLIAPDEPAPLEVVNAGGRSPFFLVCEHAGKRIPRALGTLGLAEPDLSRHIAWDIGARDTALALSRLLDAPLYMQRYSRLVCDCNRRPDMPSYMPEVSEATTIPGNLGLDDAERRRRTEAIHAPFHQAIDAALDRRAASAARTLLVSIHSFTPVFLGVGRPWQIGLLFNRDTHVAPLVARIIRRMRPDLDVGVNEPYVTHEETDYTIPLHGEARGLRCAGFEIRNDLIPDAAAAEGWARLIADALTEAEPSL
jgi:predicted N-formylglutamate amidohydrolase